MKVSALLGERFKKAPADCTIDSQALMVRGAYIKSVGTGVFSFFMPGKRIAKKIENILREEMDRIDGQEVMFPVVMPGTLWQESGRFNSIGSELLRFKDRNGVDMVLGMTHEEAAVQLARDAAKSYTQFPFMIYQIQTKFRDEPRSRGGLIRTREFTMKDAYSFHTSQEDLERYYALAYRSYERIFTRCGVPEVVAVKSDSGMMGGRISHEFMLLTDIGEDTIVICPECGYRSNSEAADCIVHNESCVIEPLEEVHTPGQKTIEEVCNFLHTDPINSCKAVLYQRNMDDSLGIVFLRGDLEVNETKLRNLIGAEVHAANVTPDMGICAGFIGMFAGFVNHVQDALSMIIVDGLHFSPELLKVLITAFWYVVFQVAVLLLIFLMLYALPARPKGHRPYSRKRLLGSSILVTFIAWFAIIIYVKILMLIQTAMVTRMSIFYGSLAFIPLVMFLVFGVWSIILCGNSLVWTICHWPEAGKRVWNWNTTSDDL